MLITGITTDAAWSGSALAPWLVGIPLLSAAVLLLTGRKSDRWGHWLGVLAPLASLAIGVVLLLNMLGVSADQRSANVSLGQWINAGAFRLDAGFRIDPLSLTFVLLVTFVGTLIHVYSVAYMEHDKDRRRFFAYMNLFVAAMLLLVTANSYLLLFVGWEGVGLASYLLIGFWNQNPVYAVAAKKAFVANRVGDIGLIVAMGLLFTHIGALDFASVDAGAPKLSPGLLTAIGLMLLLAACGKSAQFPLQSWLGDAMAGPTPVSALIHAATMVTAGVYLVVRSNVIFSAAPDARLVVTIVGAISLAFGAIVGCAKDDIKKALAASTMSQIGYMMLAAGLGPIGYAFAIMHLVTHGFFKAGLFLGAGSVMHGMDDQTDMRFYGGIGRTMKITYFTVMAGWLAILGMFPFSGFFSKDPIIESAFVPQDGQTWRAWVFGLVALIGAGVTSFYMSRLFFMTFEGKRRWTTKADGSHQHPHEAPALMTVPMIILAIGSVGLGAFLAIGDRFTTWLEPVTGPHPEGSPVIPAGILIALSLALVIGAAAFAWSRYAVSEVPVIPPVGTLVTQAARKDLYQDVVNDAALVVPGQMLTRSLVYGDRAVVDGAVAGVAKTTLRVGDLARKVQTGHVRSYAATMTLGVVVLAAVVLILGS
jgi:NADH-quinone oxidoreductase subunit L